MCTVSMIYDYGRERIPSNTWTADKLRLFQGLIDHAAEVDRELKQPDCEDPAKAAWMREIEGRLKKLEAGAKP